MGEKEMLKISVAIATYNCERTIEKCLNSVADWVYEIVVVDGKSSDNTTEIVRKFTRRLYSVDNKVNFHINKQLAIDNCQGEWILQLDSDEVVSQELKDEIYNLFKQPKNKDQRQIFDGYWIPRKNFFLGKFLTKGGQYPDYTLRLYRRGKGRLPCKSVHEQAVVTGGTDYLKNPLLHYPYADFTDYLNRSFARYTNHMSDDLKIRKTRKSLVNLVYYLFVKPSYWFLWTFFRHKGFVDGYQGFIFSLFSALHYPVAYLKFLKK